MERIVSVVGVGYVGLQNAIAFARQGLRVIGYDKDKKRVEELNAGKDRNHEANDFSMPNLTFTDELEKLKEADFFLVSVPTPINEHYVPNIFPIKNSATDLAKVLKKGDVVVLESTVFPGATRELFLPILEQESGLKSGRDFFVGYSSERINPGDIDHNLSNMYKVISGQNEKALSKIHKLYAKIYADRLYPASSLEVAEASKLLENIQRDVNIALMNEFAQVMNKMGVSIEDVLEAAKTKWNFLPFKPGLVGGHCIPEDPYYLVYQANKMGAHANLISTARQVNENFVNYIKDTVFKLLTDQNISLKGAKVCILGLSFKANVPDLRHSLSIVLFKHLKHMGLDIYTCDPVVYQDNTSFNWVEIKDLNNFDAIILAQPHEAFRLMSVEKWSHALKRHGVFMDLTGILPKNPNLRADIKFWRL